MRRSSKTVSYLTALCLWVLPVLYLAGQQHTIKGSVTDTSGVAVGGASVYLPSLSLGTVSSSDGSFRLSFTGGAGAPLLLVVSSVGYLTDSLMIMPGALPHSLSITLTPGITDIGAVEVTARRPGGINAIAIPVMAAASLPSLSGGIEAAIATLPGVASFSELSSGYSVRGGSYDENLVYVNGVEVYRPYLIRAGQQEGLSRINPDLAATVSFTPGGFNASYGDRMSSVLDITYREPEQREGSLTLSLLTSSAHAGVRSRNGALWFIAGARYRSTALLLGSLEARGAYRPHFADLQAYGGYQPAPHIRLTLSLWGSLNRYTFIPMSQTTSFGTFENAWRLYAWFQGGEHDRYDSGGGAATLEIRHSEQLTSRVIISGALTGESESYDIRGAYSLSALDRDKGTENNPDTLLNAGTGSWLSHARNYFRSPAADLSYRGATLHSRGDMEWGLTLRHRSFDASRNEWLRTDSAGYTLNEGGDMLSLTRHTLLNAGAGSLTAEGWLMSRLRLSLMGLPADLNAGIRSSYDSYSSELLISPRISMKASLSRSLTAFIAGGAYHQPPGARELMPESADSTSRPAAQRSYHLTAGIQYNFIAWERPFRFSAEAWGKLFYKMIPYRVDNVRVIYYGGNIAEGWSAGVDLRINGEFAQGAESWFSLSLMRSEIRIPSLSTGWYPAPFDQRIHLSIFFQDYLPGHPDFRTHVNLAVGTGIPTSPPGRNQWDKTFRIPPYRRIDIGFSKVVYDAAKRNRESFMRELVAGVEIFNLADIRNTISYTWIRTVMNNRGQVREYAVPNYLTRRSLNLKLSAQF